MRVGSFGPEIGGVSRGRGYRPPRVALDSKRSDSTPALEVSAVCAAYDGKRVLQDVDLRLHAGELVAVLGANGAGKSTLVRVLAGTLRPERGSVRLQGDALTALARPAVARRVAVVPQESEVAFGFSVRQVVAMGRAPHQRGLLLASASDDRIVDEVLERCDLTGLSARRVSELSGGERRRVTIARALAQEAPILLLDEPAAHLDVKHALDLFDLVRGQIRERNVACLAVMHDLSHAARFADRVVLLSGGSVVAQGSVEEAMREEVLRRVFGVSIAVGRDPASGARYFLPGSGDA